MELEIIFENESVLVINKPAGLIVHSDGRTEEPSVAEWVIKKYPDMKGVGEPWTSPQGEVVDRPGIVHRLDRTTSGVMVLAKTQDAYTFLKEQFQNRTTEKTYHAFVYGHPKQDTGVIEKEIVRLRTVPPRWGVARDGEDKKHREAVTQWHVIERGLDQETQEKVSLLEVIPKTGRTHQIRVHLKAINLSIVSDHLYSASFSKLLGFERPALHARSLTIEVPGEGMRTFEAGYPKDFENGLALLGDVADIG